MNVSNRLKLVCCLLDTCAVYFDTGSAKKRLDTYLHFVLLYFWRKKEDFGEGFPVTVELHLRESIQPLRPKFQWPKSLEAAQAAVDKLLNQAIIAKAEKDAKAKVCICASPPRIHSKNTSSIWNHFECGITL